MNCVFYTDQLFLNFSVPIIHENFMSALKRWKFRELDSASIAVIPERLRSLLVPEIAPWRSKIIAFHARALFAKKKSGGNRRQHRDARSIKRYRPPRKLHVGLNDEHRFRIFDVPFF